MLITNEKGAIDFLLFSYFGITEKNEIGEIIDATIDKAYQDATNEGAFNTLLKDESKEKIQVCKKNAEESIRELVRKCFSDDPLYDEWHVDVCKKICNSYKDISEFTYGNAQKWINMTLKNLYIIGSLHRQIYPKESAEMWKCLIDKAPEFHIPIDNYILQAVWENEKIGTPIILGRIRNIKEFNCTNSDDYILIYKDGDTYRVSDVRECPKYTWSQIPCYNLYKKIQSVLNDACGNKNTLDWENDTWIEIAYNRRKPNKKTQQSNGKT